MQYPYVNTIPGCVAPVADGPRKCEENLVVFSSKGALIMPEKLVQLV